MLNGAMFEGDAGGIVGAPLNIAKVAVAGTDVSFPVGSIVSDPDTVYSVAPLVLSPTGLAVQWLQSNPGVLLVMG